MGSFSITVLSPAHCMPCQLHKHAHHPIFISVSWGFMRVIKRNLQPTQLDRIASNLQRTYSLARDYFLITEVAAKKEIALLS